MLYRYFIFILCISLTNAYAEVVLDGTLGPKVTLDRPNYAIGAELGQQHGGNLFHSFDRFSIDAGEIATFSGPNSVNNIISRVTGGYESQIDGILRTTIPQADFYLINPAGIMFGPNAILDVQGSFHASTADTLRLKNGGQFNASQPNNSLLTVAAPEAFGFLTPSPASLSINGSKLNVPLGKTFSVVGSNLQLQEETVIFSESGRINIASVAGKGDVTLKQDDLVLSAQPSDLEINTSLVSIGSRKDAGDIYIRAGRFTLLQSTLSADTFEAGDGNDIDIEANELTISGSRLLSNTYGFRQGGDITIKVLGSVKLYGSLIKANSLGENEGIGNSGSIYLEAAQLELIDGARISASTNSSGQAGNTNLKITGDIILSGENSQGKTSGIFASSYNTGNAGNLQIEAEQLILKDGAAIAAEAWSSGHGGNITIHVKESINLSGINSAKDRGSFITTTTKGSGNSGTMEIKTGQLHITDGGQIRAAVTENAKGQGGNIDIKAENITVSGKGGKWGESGIFASTMEKATGDAGNIFLAVQELNIQDGAKVGSSTFGTGKGGTVKVDANRIYLRGGGAILARSLEDAQGDAGSIAITTNTARLTQGSRIATSATQAGGGNIKLQVHKYLYLFDNSEITAHAGGTQTQDKGGNITIESPDIFRLDNSNLLANAYAGNGGKIDIATNDFKVFGNSRIDVSSELGLNGEFILNSTKIRDKDFAPLKLGQLPEFSPNRCVDLKETLNQFIITIRDISPPTPEDLKTHYYIP